MILLTLILAAFGNRLGIPGWQWWYWLIFGLIGEIGDGFADGVVALFGFHGPPVGEDSDDFGAGHLAQLEGSIG